MPQNPQILASKTATGPVNIFNTSQFPSIPSSTEVVKTAVLTGHTNEGYGLEWSKLQKGLLCSGSDDCVICVWQVDENCGNSIAPSISYRDRECVIEVLS